MSNYEAVKPLTKTEDLVSCQSKRHLCVIKHCVTLRSPNINTRKMLAPRAVQGSSVKGHFSTWQPHSEEAIWLSVPTVWAECGMKRLRAASGVGAGRAWLTWPLRQDSGGLRLLAHAFCERHCEDGQVVCGKMSVLFPFCLSVRHFSLRGLQEHTTRGGIILRTSVLYPNHCDLAVPLDSK